MRNPNKCKYIEDFSGAVRAQTETMEKDMESNENGNENNDSQSEIQMMIEKVDKPKQEVCNSSESDEEEVKETDGFQLVLLTAPLKSSMQWMLFLAFFIHE